MSSAGQAGPGLVARTWSQESRAQPSTQDQWRRRASEGPGSPKARCPTRPPLHPSHDPGKWGVGVRIKQAYCSSALAHKLALEGEEEREKEREREAGSAGGLASSLRRLPGQEVGGCRGWGGGAVVGGTPPSRGSGGGRGRLGCAALVEEGPRGHGDSGGGEEGEREAGGGRPSTRAGRGGIPGCILWR